MAFQLVASLNQIFLFDTQTVYTTKLFPHYYAASLLTHNILSTLIWKCILIKEHMWHKPQYDDPHKQYFAMFYY